METIYQHELQAYARDSRRAMRSYRIRYQLRHGLATLGSMTMWSIVVATALPALTGLYA